ncbi:YHS domain-containing protein [Bosea sp. BE271]|uniref:YHS domain-containing (seleno)protein n=1 Tax=Bosea TaxID=85413 RepID=UPI0028676908|nr:MULTISPECIES: YHS domain-containing (seleno)protein [Bosea]MDR6830794.1 YHS domain-containing protein [Bosea robiniae]MDR6895451.1 YHS domain-containing protein [Bosea sp. BE109]MDR7138847.1 YHS domain-containing protein [Bosea sp. BE168]MDR7175548.1 YHS domain-containing protein [Bosea sp. BE271]
MNFRKTIQMLACAVALTGASTVAAIAADSINQVDGVALHGFDPVAYFVQKRPLKGDPEITYQHNGVTYEFYSASNLELFKKSPEKYIPQYGGFCAFAVAAGAKADIDPYAYAINDGKLYLNFSTDKRDSFQKKPTENVAKANGNWPKVEPQEKIYR